MYKENLLTFGGYQSLHKEVNTEAIVSCSHNSKSGAFRLHVFNVYVHFSAVVTSAPIQCCLIGDAGSLGTSCQHYNVKHQAWYSCLGLLLK